ncbi:hypothetical protein QBC42DRAFT_193276 [Cladorrhinum samala]|uniref:Uncharacterized protein n=1 Tax=Cladorrhinum samala TaxID=585594 RepID=A0AAV9I316_9PEZI|nr:hypothetical protein QBC42DRAFT_193276 [Cladorrhinum samala]
MAHRQRPLRQHHYPPPSSHARLQHIENLEYERERPRTADGDMSNGGSRWGLLSSPTSHSQLQLPAARRSRSRESTPSTPVSPSSSGSGGFSIRRLHEKIKNSFSTSSIEEDDMLSYAGDHNRGRSSAPGAFMNGRNSAVPTTLDPHPPAVDKLPGSDALSSVRTVDAFIIAAEERKGGITTITAAAAAAAAGPAPPRVSSLITNPNPNRNSNSNPNLNSNESQALSPMDQARIRMNFLEEELRKTQNDLSKTQHELNERNADILAMLTKDGQSDSKIAELEEALHAAEVKSQEETTALEERLVVQGDMIERLRERAAEAASRAANGPAGLAEQSRLRVPEPEIFKRWQELSYKVHNFVRCYLKDQKKVKRWVQEGNVAKRWLEEVSPNYQKLALDKKAGIWFIEAAIWAVLWRRVLSVSTTCGNVCWAGRLGRGLQRLSISLFTSIQPGPNEQEHTRQFHQWKAVTTSLVNSLGPHVNDGRQIHADVMEDLEDLLEPWKGNVSDGIHVLRDIVSDAIALDEVFCAQVSWYQLTYPDKRYDRHFDQNMTRAEGSSSQRAVGFVVRPALYRSGGSARGETYDRWFVLDPTLVWT